MVSAAARFLRERFGEPEELKWDSAKAIVSQFQDPVTGKLGNKGAAGEILCTEQPAPSAERYSLLTCWVMLQMKGGTDCRLLGSAAFRRGCGLTNV
eukprot:413778-Rhodomonas_salina.2